MLLSGFQSNKRKENYTVQRPLQIVRAESDVTGTFIMNIRVMEEPLELEVIS
jgi:hypothetical protein